MTELVKGQNTAISAGEVLVTVRSAAEVDVSALLVTADGKVRSDADFIFFNQASGPGVRLEPGTPGALRVSFAGVPAEIAQVRVVLTLSDPAATFGAFAPPRLLVRDASENPLCEYVIDGLSSESVVIGLELYRRGADWKLRAVGQGYAGGFAALVTDHGVSVDDEPAAEPGVRTVPGEEKLSLDKRERLDLRKREVVKVLLTKGAGEVRARVVLVIDKTGSMSRLYHEKVVHRVVQRMIPVAIQLDDDGKLEPYLYAIGYTRLPDVTVATVDEWAETYLHLSGTHGGIDYTPLGNSNREEPIMQEIISTLRPGGPPTLVLFFTDGGFRKKREIAALMREAAALPAFWQFVGLGEANYGLLRSMDEMDGRVVDNAGFFAVDDIDRLTDADLYSRLLGEFPDWLRAARSAGVLQ
ncbi:VWA domain-containing protein [Nocardia yamanashiensis]|uniref:vWA domain-containing protein n=1 Tax=Nocardia yamanashiensis TaxID=209247 RepID=UPI001E3FF13E|nr:VWA domain-containing protein [Nocardia yamanashiensis]UGT38614.1 VWA domain-containing protein [Nocardia yamanashiensis]